MKLTKRVILLGSLIISAVILSACAANVANGASRSQQDAEGGVVNVITVSGTGSAYGTPDMATVELGVQARNGNIATATAEVNSAIDDVKAALLAMGIDEKDIQTTNFSIWPEEEWDPETGRPTNQRTFHVQNNIRVNIRDTDKISDVIETALDNGANQVYGLYFSIEDTTALETEARAAAVENARAHADDYAEALNLSVGQVVHVSEVSSGYQPIPYASNYAAEDAAMGGASISEGQLSISISVTISYAIEY